MVIAKIGFRDEEFLVPFHYLKNKGVVVDVASTESGQAVGKLGAKVDVDLAFHDVNLVEYSGIIIVGGPGSRSLVNNPELEGIASTAIHKGLLVGAICYAPVILAQAGLIHGKKATAWNGDGHQKPILEERGAVFVDESVVVDGNLVTGNGPDAAEAFAEAVYKKLME